MERDEHPVQGLEEFQDKSVMQQLQCNETVSVILSLSLVMQYQGAEVVTLQPRLELCLRKSGLTFSASQTYAEFVNSIQERIAGREWAQPVGLTPTSGFVWAFKHIGPIKAAIDRWHDCCSFCIESLVLSQTQSDCPTGGPD